jgi:hypothetical protein
MGIVSPFKSQNMVRLNTGLIYLTFLLGLLCSCAKQPKPKLAVTYPGYHKNALGASSKDLLRDDVFTSLTVEVQYMDGFRPEPETIDTLAGFLQSHLNKPAGLRIVMKQLQGIGRKTMAKDHVAALEDSVRTRYATDQDLALYLLFTNGRHPDKDILGMAYRNTSAVIFGRSIAVNSGPGNILTKSELETSVLLHEVGHLLGLGNSKGTALSSKKGAGKHGHCDNKTCLMYWSTATKNLSAITRRGRIPQLDDECLEFIERVKAKPVPRVPAGPIDFMGAF